VFKYSSGDVMASLTNLPFTTGAGDLVGTRFSVFGIVCPVLLPLPIEDDNSDVCQNSVTATTQDLSKSQELKLSH
jgi:hypothetical protein